MVSRVVELSDGARIEIRVGAAQDGEGGSWGVSMQSLTADAVKFLFELASAGNFFVEDDNIAVTTSAATKERFKVPEVDCVVAGSAEEMGILLKGGFEAWQAYAKGVTGK